MTPSKKIMSGVPGIGLGKAAVVFARVLCLLGEVWAQHNSEAAIVKTAREGIVRMGAV
jgi:hypothetical protein